MTLFPQLPSRAARFSSCGRYRYTLHMPIREAFAPAIVWILANPSTADAIKEDPTTRNVQRISENLGYSTAIVLNVCAYRTPYPLDLLKALDAGVDVVGVDNTTAIATTLSAHGVKRVVFGWGDCFPDRPELNAAIETVKTITQDLGFDPVCFGKNKSGNPRHPLFLAALSDHKPFYT